MIKKFRVYPDGTIENSRGITRGSDHGSGYKTIHNPRTKKMVRVHRLVAQRYIPNPNNYPEVNHIDGNKSNNHYTNLEWCIPSMNIKHAFDTGLAKGRSGSKHHNSKLTEDVVREIKRLLKETNFSLKEMGKMFSVSPRTISNIKQGRRWSHVEVNYD